MSQIKKKFHILILKWKPKQLKQTRPLHHSLYLSDQAKWQRAKITAIDLTDRNRFYIYEKLNNGLMLIVKLFRDMTIHNNFYLLSNSIESLYQVKVM